MLTFLLFLDSSTRGSYGGAVAVKKMPIVDWIRGKVACTSVTIARLIYACDETRV